MQYLSEERRDAMELQLLKAVAAALVELQAASSSEHEAARKNYMQALREFNEFTSQHPHMPLGNLKR